ncbi:MAG: peptidoglycan editing factor PgeF [Burkholderiales bacterium]|nr:peptidoglycan editing factor PgeF [Burkholderiales bacterium]
MSTRAGGISTGAFASLNLGRSVGDLPQAVAENRRRFVASLRIDASAAGGSGARPARPVWLHQVHGTSVLELDEQTAEHPQAPADAAWTRTRGIACIVGAADCLPVLFAARDGRAVAAAHAGWRGLAAGVLEATVGALGRGAGVPPAELLAWLGPCIGARRFEVGADVLRAFGALPRAADSTQFPHFRHAPRPDGEPRWLADLRGLATQRLRSLGVGFIAAADACTYEDASRFFSFRRDSRGGTGSPSGRMAAAVSLEAGAS